MIGDSLAGRINSHNGLHQFCPPTKCPLHAPRTNAVPGDGPPTARLMIIGEAPGKEEELAGQPFVGAGGKFLNSVLEGTGIARDDFVVTKTGKCRPPKNRTPRKLEV